MILFVNFGGIYLFQIEQLAFLIFAQILCYRYTSVFLFMDSTSETLFTDSVSTMVRNKQSAWVHNSCIPRFAVAISKQPIR